MPVPTAMRGGKRTYTPAASRNWRLLGFAEYPTRSTQGQQDIRVPVISDRFPRAYGGNVQGIQLRTYVPLISTGYNIAFASHTGQEYQPPAAMLATNKTGTGLGIGKLKNLNVKAEGTLSNLLAKATSYGRLSGRIPSG
jgi:hypothetical protein